MACLLLPKSRPLIVLLALARSSHAFASIHAAPRRGYSGSSSVSGGSATALRDMPAKRVLVPIADGSEEIETACLTDTLTRFGAQVTVASVAPAGRLTCRMSRGLRVEADCAIDACHGQDWDLVVLPGGMPGAEHLRDSEALVRILQAQKQAGKLYGAVCASPAVALAPHGLVQGEAATCYPSPKFRDALKETSTSVKDDPVVASGKLITSQGPGTSLLFALRLGEELYGKEKRDEITKQLLL